MVHSAFLDGLTGLKWRIMSDWAYPFDFVLLGTEYITR